MPRGRYTRRVGQRRYRRIFVISTEGTNTEPQYFRMFNDDNTTVRNIRVLRHSGPDPMSVLRSMMRFLRSEELWNDDAAWLIVDKDRWTDGQLRRLLEWTHTDVRYGLAVSNPMFEYWLLLHFEDGHSVGSSGECTTRLRRHLPDYHKNLQPSTLRKLVSAAVLRAERRDTPPCIDWPRITGTTVYRLVRDLIGTV